MAEASGVFFEGSAVWNACAPSVASSIRHLTARWGPYSTKSRRYSLYRLFGEVVGPAWSAYTASFSARHVGRRLAAELDLHTAAREFGFDGLRQRLEQIVRAAYRQQDQKAGPSFGPDTVAIRPARRTSVSWPQKRQWALLGRRALTLSTAEVERGAFAEQRSTNSINDSSVCVKTNLFVFRAGRMATVSGPKDGPAF
jgi:hypothetical protein